MTMIDTARSRRGLMSRLRDYRKAEGGSVTLQVLFMSIALFGSTGLVLDSGRLYSKHTQMQAFTDQMALAAANELDGKTDSISRARAAVEGLSGSTYLSKFDSSGNEFTVDQIAFYTDFPPADRTTTGPGNLTTPYHALGNAADFMIIDESDPDNARAAQFVAVVAQQWKVGNLVGPLSRLITPTGNVGNTCNGGDCPESEIPLETDVKTVAVATLQQITCADISNLVLCNPWEDEVVDSYDTQTVPGRTVRYFAPNFERALVDAQQVTGGSFSQGVIGSLWDYDERNQIHLLSDPIADPAGICGLDFVLGFTRSGDDETDLDTLEYLEARDRCLLARARSETLCFENTIGVRPAPGPLLLEGVNVAFDIWLPPMDEMLNVGIGDQTVPNTGGLELAWFFEPDQNVYTRWMTVTDSGGAYRQWQVEYDTIPGPGYTLRTDIASRQRYASCHLSSYEVAAGGTAPASNPACSLPLVSDAASMTTLERNQYLQAMYRDHPYDPIPSVPADVDTWYEFYQHERDAPLVDPNATTSQVTPYKGSTANAGYEAGNPDNYLAVVATPLAPGYERRKIRSAMVNCGEMYALDDRSELGDGLEFWRTEIMAVLDIHLPEPATMYCGSGVLDCTVDQSLETMMMIEYVEDVTDEAFMQRSIAMLIR